MKRDVRSKVDNSTYVWIKDVVKHHPDLTVSTITNYALEHLRNNVTGVELKVLANKVAAQKAQDKKRFMSHGDLRRVK